VPRRVFGLSSDAHLGGPFDDDPRRYGGGGVKSKPRARATRCLGQGVIRDGLSWYFGPRSNRNKNR